MSNGDALVELRAWRDEFARSHGYDLRAMAAALRELDGAAGREVVRGEPRRPEPAKREDARTPTPALQPSGAAVRASRDHEPLPAAPAAEQ
jgi:hypothetical protein